MKNTNGFNYNQFIDTISDDEIVKYVKEQYLNSEEKTQRQMKDFKENPDIYDEFKYCYFSLKHGNNDVLNYAVEGPVTEQGYTAFSLFYKFGSQLSPLEIFNLLIELRKEPDKTLEYIKAGFSKK